MVAFLVSPLPKHRFKFHSFIFYFFHFQYTLMDYIVVDETLKYSPDPNNESSTLLHQEWKINCEKLMFTSKLESAMGSSFLSNAPKMSKFRAKISLLLFHKGTSWNRVCDQDDTKRSRKTQFWWRHFCGIMTSSEFMTSLCCEP